MGKCGIDIKAFLLNSNRTILRMLHRKWVAAQYRAEIEDLQGNFVVIPQTQQDLVGKAGSGQCWISPTATLLCWVPFDQQPGSGGQGFVGY